MIFTILGQNNDRQLACPHVCANSDFAWWRSVCESLSLSGCNQLTAPRNWVVQWVVDISVFQHSLECSYSRCSYKTLQTMLKPAHIEACNENTKKSIEQAAKMPTRWQTSLRKKQNTMLQLYTRCKSSQVTTVYTTVSLFYIFCFWLWVLY